MSFGMALEEQPENDDYVLEEKGIRLFVDPLSAGFMRAGLVVDHGPGGFRISRRLWNDEDEDELC